MPARKPLSSALPPDAAAFLRGDAPSPAEPPAPPPAAAAPPAAVEEARVRFTVDLPRSLHKRLKLAALNRDEPMTDLSRRILTEWLEANG